MFTYTVQDQSMPDQEYQLGEVVAFHSKLLQASTRTTYLGSSVEAGSEDLWAAVILELVVVIPVRTEQIFVPS